MVQEHSLELYRTYSGVVCALDRMVENGVVKMEYDQPPAVAHGATSPPSIDEVGR